MASAAESAAAESAAVVPGWRPLAPDFRLLASAAASTAAELGGCGVWGVARTRTRARVDAGVVAVRTDFEPTELLIDDDPDRADDPAESSGAAAAGAAATAQPTPNATAQPAIRPAFLAVVRVIGTAIAPVPKSQPARTRSISTSSSLMCRVGQGVCRVAKVTDRDRRDWDDRYSLRTPPGPEDVRLPMPFAEHADRFPSVGDALDLACGRGLVSVWLARRGLNVRGVDVSEVAVAQARKLAQDTGVIANCQFDVVDLDTGLPSGPQANMIVCLHFRDRRLDRAIIDRLSPGGLLAISALSQVGAGPGRFCALPGELTDSFAELDHIAGAEGDGQAWLLASKPGSR